MMRKRTDPAPELLAVLADLSAVIERAAADLALAEEPAGFVAALDEGAPGPPGARPEGGVG